jgi:callose synthase
MTWNNDFVQAFLNICYPTSQLYVGKSTHVPQKHVFVYVIFWLVLIVFKLWFSYRYIVYPVTIPSLELYDDYVNFGQDSFFSTALLFFVWWFPHYLVYLIDLSIWYSVLASFVGGFIALVDRQGAVRDAATFRSHFMKSPIAFCQRLMPSSSKVNAQARNIAASTASLNNIVTDTAALMTNGKKAPVKAVEMTSKPQRNYSAADLFSQPSTSTSHSGKVNRTEEINANPASNLMESAASSLGESIGLRWLVFAKVWNEIIVRLRNEDHINDTEKDNFMFSLFDQLSKPVYLPLYQTAGCFEVAMCAFKDASVEFNNETEPEKKISVVESFFTKGMDLTTREAVNEVRELTTVVLMKLLGPIHVEDMSSITSTLELWGSSSTGELFARMDANTVNGLIKSLTTIVSTLKGSIGKRSKNIVVTAEVIKQHEETIEQSEFDRTQSKDINPASSMKKSISTGFLSGLADHNDSSATASKKKSTRFAKLQPFRKKFTVNDTVRDKIREELRNLLSNLRNSIRSKSNVASESKDIIDRLTFVLSMESGFFWSDIYASKQIDEMSKNDSVISIIKKLNGLLGLQQSQVS